MCPDVAGWGVLLPDDGNWGLALCVDVLFGGLLNVNIPSLYFKSGGLVPGDVGAPDTEYRVLGMVLLVYVSTLPLGSSRT